MSILPFIHRVKLRNYKSIDRCDVRLGPLAVLVGPNGSGKSNFLDALAFTRQALDMTLDHALRERGGINEVRRRSGGHPSNFSIELHFTLGDGVTQGLYSFEVTSQRNGGFSVRKEICEVGLPTAIGSPTRFVVREGSVEESTLSVPLPRPAPDRLFLVSASNVDEFRPIYDALTGMAFYSFSPDVMRLAQPPDPGDLLQPEGKNLASVISSLEKRNEASYIRIQKYLKDITPGVEGVGRIAMGNLETLQFRQRVAGQRAPWRFPAINMSDGTLRALAVLTALLQGDGNITVAYWYRGTGNRASPGCGWDLMGRYTGRQRSNPSLGDHPQPDLLDRKDIPTDVILATDSEAGTTQIGPIIESSREAIRDRLATPGELLRQKRLRPEIPGGATQSDMFNN